MEEILFIHYPKCSTCQKALKDLEEKGFSLKKRNIVEEKLSYEEWKEIKEKHQIELSSMWNVQGLLYKELGLKKKRETMSEEEQLQCLASQGMLVKRPVLVTEEKAFFAYNAKAKAYFEQKSKEAFLRKEEK